MTGLTALLARADALKRRLDAARHLIGAQLQAALDVEYTYESNRIEGNSLSLRETELVVSQGLTLGDRTLREHLAAVNHHAALLRVRELAAAGAAPDEGTVRELHALVLHGIDRDHAGRYRALPALIPGSRHLPPQPWEVPGRMEEYGGWLAGAMELHPVVRAAEAHERLASIHPFSDGNGRTARLAMNLILLAAGYPVANIPGDAASRHAYFDALERCDMEGDNRGFILFVVGGLLHGMQALLGRLGAH